MESCRFIRIDVFRAEQQQVERLRILHDVAYGDTVARALSLPKYST